MLPSDILEFLDSKQTTLLLTIAPNTFLEILRDIKVNVDFDNMETNGWEVDYFVKATYKKQKLYISGSAWYGSAKIAKTKNWD